VLVDLMQISNIASELRIAHDDNAQDQLVE